MKKKFIKNMNETTRKTISCLFVLVYTIMQILSPLTVYADTKDETPQKGDIRNNNIVVEDDNIRVTKTVTPVKDANGNVIEGKYTVGFDFVGKETEISTTTPLYAVIVFDTSGSMICNTESYSSMYNPWLDWSGYDYEAADGAKVRCESEYGYHMGDHLLQSKWESAVSGAQDFAKEIMEIEDSQVSVVTFSTSAETATKWYTANSSDLSNGTIPAAVFRHPYGGTNLSEGIDNAVTKLNSITEENANKIIIVVSDGEPTQPEQNNNSSYPIDLAKSSANTAKNSGIKIFTIGYETTTTADQILSDVSGSNIEGDETTYNYTASEGNLSGIFTSIATSILNIVNANSITLTDNLGASFHFSDGIGNTYTHEIETITTEGTHVEFEIEIDPDSPTGWNPTNNGYSLTYTTGSGEVTLSTNQNPEVYWIQQEYNYTINYYLDNTNGNPVHTETNTNVLNAKIDVDEEKYLSEYTGYEYTGSNDLSITISKNESENVINVVYTKVNYNYTINYYLDNTNGNPVHSDNGTGNYGDPITVTEDKYLSEHPGYEYTGGELDSTIAIEGNVINVVYTKKVYDYTINYYLDDTTGNPVKSESGQGVYGDAILVDETKYLANYTGYEYVGNELDTTISTNPENNIINVVYTKQNFILTVNYYFDGNPNPVLTKKPSFQYGTPVYASSYVLTTTEIEDGHLNGYRLHPTTPYNPTYVTVDAANKVINIYYVSLPSDDTDGVTKTTNDTITTTDDTVTYTINYKNVLHNVIGTVTVTIVDTLPLSIDLDNSNLDGGVYNSDNNTITWIKTYQIDEFAENYIINIDDDNKIEYTVKYNDINAEYSYTGEVYTNKVNASVSVNYEEDKTTFDDTDDTSDVNVEIYGNLTVEYVTYVDDKKVNLTDDISNEELVGTPYKTEEKKFYGYKLKENSNNTTGKYTEEDIIVTYVYEKNTGTIEDELSKVGPKEISGIDTPFEYTITYKAIISDYVGEAKVTITDNLAYTIDTELSDLDGGVYNSNNNTITWTETYRINAKNNEISIEKKISIVYKDLNDDNITNSATSVIELEKIKTNTTDEVSTKLNKGKVVVHYIEKDTNINLSEDIVLEDYVGKEYTTEEIEIDDYFLSEVIGETSSKYKDETIVVTYVYEKKGQGTNILPPQTGMNVNANNPYIFYILSTLILVIVSLFKKRINE